MLGRSGRGAGAGDVDARRLTASRLRRFVTTATTSFTEQQRVDRAVNTARIVAGLIVLALGPFFPNIGVAHVITLGAVALVYGIVLRALFARSRDAAEYHRTNVIAFAADLVVMSYAMLVFASDPKWATFMFGTVVVIIGAFRFGARGAWTAVVVLGAVMAAIAYLREITFGYSFEPQRVVTQVSLYVLVALLMTRVLSELHALRERQSEFYEPLLRAQADLGHAIVVNDRGRPVYWNEALCELTGRTNAEIAALPSIHSLLHPEEREAVRLRAATRLEGAQGDRFETRLIGRDGSSIEVEVALEPFAHEERLSILIARDIGERKQAQRALEHQAMHDPLTGLANRALLRDRIDKALARAEREREPVALLIMDVDQFKHVNDAYGHETGDELLCKVAQRLLQRVRAADTVARLGGDEFAVLLPKTSLAAAEGVARAMIAALEPLVRLGDHEIAVSASVGVTAYPDHGTTSTMLLRQADMAMYVAKRAGSGHAVYHDDHDEHQAEKLELVSQLRDALGRGEIQPHFQPLVRLRTGRAQEVEALARWEHPERGPISPAEFIPVAERAGLVRPIFDVVVTSALAARQAWAAGGTEVTVAVNLSGRDVQDATLTASIARALERAGAPASALRLEITETVLMADRTRALTVLAALHGMGVRLSIDDFGTGYSSLAYLQTLPVDQLKIDRSFVMNMTRHPGSAAIVRSTIDLGHNFGLELVAEGVEDQATAELLKEHDCDTAQGFHFAKPMSVDEIGIWLREQEPAEPRLATVPRSLKAI